MKAKHWSLWVVFALLFLPACGQDSPTDDGGDNPPPPPHDMSEALEGYWTAQEDVTAGLLDLVVLMDQIEEAAERGVRSQAQMDEVAAYVDQYVAKSELVAADFETLIALEEQIVPYGERGMFTNLVGGVCKGVYNAAKNVVVSSGQMVRTGWRVMSGSHSLRDALGAPDSGIPLVSGWAQDLQRTAQRRNEYIAQEIANGDHHEGWIPDVPGATPQERAQNYMNLPEDDPIKRQAHENFLLWCDEGWEDCLSTLKDATKTGVKAYGEAVSGSGTLVEVTEQLTTTGQDPEAKAPVTPEIVDGETDEPVDEPKTMIISKRNQPESEPRIVVLEGVDPEFEVELPEGQYDIITIADEYIRAAELGLQVVADQATGFVAELLEFASNSLVLESLTASPEVAAIGETVSCSASAASTIGSALSFDWQVDGQVTGLSADGPACSFAPAAAGDYTVTVTVSDDFGNSKSLSAEIIATPVEIDVTDFRIAGEQVPDGDFNPGELLTVDLDIANGSDGDMTGDILVTGDGGITVPAGSHPGTTIAAGATVTRQISVQLPADYSEDTGGLLFHFETDQVIIEQLLLFDVAFYVEIDPVSSPVTDRILTLTGTVANPLLPVAHLAIDGDYEQLYEIDLNSNGSFWQEVVVEGSVEEVEHVVTLMADSGSWHEEDTEQFTSQVPPAGFRVTLTWDTGGTDVDLWVTDPFGTKCYFGNSYVAESGLQLDTDDTNGYGPENISSLAPPEGAYFVQAHYWSDHDSENAIGTNCTIVIREHEGTEDETVRSYSGFLGDSGDIWDVTTIDVGTRAAGPPEPIDRYHYVDPATLPAK